ncbi:hypothetical protein PN836_004195 [Ningiella sp. W23]|uniref:hypothetical protein n=1 Tax=Ningiella sp. W23 TaxID=3023715 RepID=UPI003758114F
MKKLITSALIWFIAIVLIFKTVSTVSLCGGTFMQNWMGLGACNDSQSQFMGLGDIYFEGRELFGAALLALFIIVLSLVWLKCGRKRAG